MKIRFKNIFILFVMSAFAISCSDAYDITQKGEADRDASIQNLDDLEGFLFGIYAGVDTTNEIFLSSVLTDELGVGASNGGNNRNLHRYVFQSNNGFSTSMWYSNFSVINRVNRMIEVAEVLAYDQENPAEVARFNSLLAEARVLRAFCYVQLQTYFTTDMKDDSALGVMLIDFVPDYGDKFPRATNGEIFQLIEEDLAFAEDNLVNRTVNGYKYVSDAMVSALRARFYLYRGDHVKAKQYAQDAISQSGVGLVGATTLTVPAGFPGGNTWAALNAPSTPNQYKRMWNDFVGPDGRGEIIFSLDRPEGGAWGNIAGLFYFNQTHINGSIMFDMGRNLYNSLTALDSDIRQYAFVDHTAIISPDPENEPQPITADQLPIDKYPGKGTQQLRNDLKVFRISEMKFILAECAIVEGQLGDAAQHIFDVRNARNYANPKTTVMPSYSNPTEAWKDVLLERRRELCFEGHRYIDLKRLGTIAGEAVDRSPVDLDIEGILTLPVTDYRFTFPIPNNEMLANPLMVQNPGY